MHMHRHACACRSQAKRDGSATVDPLRLSPVSDGASPPAPPLPSAARSKPRQGQAAKPAARKLPAAAAAVEEEEDSDDDVGAAAAAAAGDESEEEEESLAARRARAPPAAKRAKPAAASRPTAAAAKPAPSKPASAAPPPRAPLGKPSPPLRPQLAPGAAPAVQPLGGGKGRATGMLNQVANQGAARSGGAKPAPAEGGGAGFRSLGGGDGGGGGGSWSASPVGPGTPPLPASLGQGGAAAGEAAPQLLLHASMDLQLELLRSLHVRRSHIGAWLKQPSWLPGGPRGLLVKVKANMGHNSTEYVVAEIVQACADGRLELKAPSGALNQTPGEPCWYPYEFVSNGAMQHHELLLAPTPTLTPTLTPTPSLTQPQA